MFNKMNLNPFVFSYKCYPNSKLATSVSQFCSGMQRVFGIFTVGIMLVVVLGGVSNCGEAIIGAGIMFILWLILKLNKEKWSDRIAAKQEEIDNMEK